MILIISDYHQHEELVLDLIKAYQPELTLCLGDGESSEEFYLKNKIISVKGNCDYANLPLMKVVSYHDHRFLLSHGHETKVIFGLTNLYYHALEENCDYVFYGHTHIPHLEEIDGITFLNPGALKEGNYAIINEKFEIELKSL